MYNQLYSIKYNCHGIYLNIKNRHYKLHFLHELKMLICIKTWPLNVNTVPLGGQCPRRLLSWSNDNTSPDSHGTACSICVCIYSIYIMFMHMV